MGNWSFTRTSGAGGRYQLVITRRGPHGRAVDITSFRGAPTQLDSYSSGDPFGDSTAQFSFPSITPFDDFTHPSLSTWLCHYADVDLYWVPAVPIAARYAGLKTVLNPISGQADLVTPAYLLDSGGNRIGQNRVKVWEGFLASMDFTGDASTASLQISCQGALFQLDRYLQKPFFPARPWPLELLIRDAFSHQRKPNLRTRRLITQFPSGWKLTIPKRGKSEGVTIYTPMGKPGDKWSGYITRQTGSWDHTLTGFVQDQLTVMITDTRSGVTTGNQWTIAHQRASGALHGRQPIMKVRDRFAAADFALWYGTPGVEIRLSSDSTQSENIIYGDGTSVDGTTWRNAEISSDGSRTDYVPLAASRDVYPANKHEFVIVDGQEFAFPFVSEAYTKFGTGFDQPKAVLSAKQQLERDRNPGWTGTITLSIDPALNFPRATIHAGLVLKLKGFNGSGETGVNFHISAAQHSPMTGTVELTVDTRFRDLLTVEEAQARTRDPLTPVKMLQVNRTSVMIEDIQAPWDYAAGSGFIPRPSRALFRSKPSSVGFPYTSWTKKFPPKDYPSYYTKVRANSATSYHRWTQNSVPVLTSEKDSIIRSEFVCVDFYGRVLKIPFHVGIYSVPLTPEYMPHDGSDYSAWRNNAFLTIDPETGNPFPSGSTNAPDNSVLVLWGGQIDGVLNRAGFSPGRESAGDNATGLLVDESSWSYDNTSNPDYRPTLEKTGKLSTEPLSAIQLAVMYYAEHTEPVYFLGRLYRQSPGVS